MSAAAAYQGISKPPPDPRRQAIQQALWCQQDAQQARALAEQALGTDRSRAALGVYVGALKAEYEAALALLGVW